MEHVVTRQLDELGRIVLPIDLREELEWVRGTELEVLVDPAARQVLLKEPAPRCVFCKGEGALRRFSGKYICEDCLQELYRL